jgi:hypothetical protein
MAKTKNKMNRSQKIGLGVGIAAATAAAAAGAYFLYGKNGAKNRRKVKSWMLKARAEVLQKMEALESVSEEKYREIVDSVVRGYKQAKKASPAELTALAAELKGHWSEIRKSFREHAPRAAGTRPRKRNGSATGKRTAAARRAKRKN